MPLPRLLLGLFLAIALLGLPRDAEAGPEISTTGGVAIHGADAVAYFTAGRAVAGTQSHALMWAGAIWYFSSGANMAAFEANPRAYAPQYGGHCAWSAARGELRPGRPEAFVIHEGKLYLAVSEEAVAALKADMPGQIAAANANWHRLMAD